MRVLTPILSALGGGLIQFFVMQADHAATEDFWKKYDQGAKAKHEFWDRYTKAMTQPGFKP